MLFGRFPSNRLNALSAGDHNHDADYEPKDATILKDADIGVTVEAFDAAIVKSDEAEVITASWIFHNATEPITIKGEGTGNANIAFLRFEDSAGTHVGSFGFGSAANSSMVLRNSLGGTLELGTDNSTDLTIASGGAATFVSTVTATNFIDASDRRLKEEISDFCGCKFEDVKFKKYKLKKGDDRWQYGVIADELKRVYPELVYTDNDGMLGVDYRSLTVIGLQRLQSELISLKRIKDMSLWGLIKWKLFR